MPIFVYNPALVVIILSELVVASFINKNDTFCENPATYRLFPMKRITSRLARSIIFLVETKKVFVDFFKSKLVVLEGYLFLELAGVIEQKHISLEFIP